MLETEGLTARGSAGNTVAHPLTKIATNAALPVRYGIRNDTLREGEVPCRL